MNLLIQAVAAIHIQSLPPRGLLLPSQVYPQLSIESFAQIVK